MFRIAVDGMGGDSAPAAIVDGVVRAAEQFDDLHLLLVGPTEQLHRELETRSARNPRIELVEAPEVIEMDESPVGALRKKPHSTIRVMTRLLKEGRTDALFSAGNTGAMVAAATMLLGLLPGVRRPGIAVTIPVGKRPVVLIDVGANVQCKPRDLFYYGLMAAEFMTRVYGVENPRAGLLNVGQEEQKGNLLVKETKQLFQDSHLHFHGNVEGGEIFHGNCDVVVCDGFVGNIVLKVSEGLSEHLISLLRDQLRSIGNPSDRPTSIHQALGSFAAQVDYAEYGGASLLGVDGHVIIGHGRSDGKAVANALRWARETHRAQINENIVHAIERARAKG